MSKAGVILFSHGSRTEGSNRAFKKFVEDIEKKENIAEIRHAFLEFTGPGLKETAEELISRGVSKIVVVPVFLFPGKHVQDDLPKLVEELKGEHEKVEFVVTEVIASHPKFKGLIEERIKEGKELVTREEG